MGAKAPPPHWIAEDDVVLRNAVEAGASLESLAKGAVQFSRRFTVKELQDRWYSLLYDPIVSVEASPHMIEFERWGFTSQSRPNKSEGGKDIARKRKHETIRKLYYSMRKRIRNEPFDTTVINLVSGPCYSKSRDGNGLLSADCNPALNNLSARGPDFEFLPHAAESNPTFGGVQNHRQENVAQKNVSDNLPFPYEENISLNPDCTEITGFINSKDLPLDDLFEDGDLVNFGFPPPSADIPIWHNSEDISEAGLPIQTGDGDEFMIPPDSNESDALRYGGEPSNPKLEMMDINSSTQEYITQLFDLSNDEGLLYMNNDGNEAIEKSYLEDLSSLLLESPSQCELPGSCLGEPADSVYEQLIDTHDTHNGDSNMNSHEVADALVIATGSAMIMKVGPEYRNGFICCVLNTEDPEIPSNDDVFLPFRFPSPTKSGGAYWGLHDHTHLGSSSMKSPSYSIPPTKMESLHPSDGGSRYRRDNTLKFELPESSVQHAALREARSSSANVNSNNFNSGGVKGKSVSYTSLNPCPDRHGSSSNVVHVNPQKNTTGSQSGVDGVAEIPNNGLSNADSSFQQIDISKATDQTLLSDNEEVWSENEFDVPCFSDVEAMILDMDLSPDESDFCNNPEVQRYQHEETKRTIIRLEQAADAFTQRLIAVQGAFAVLYGRYSKFFIKKPEVLIGRATEDFEVDIDLGREKNGSKISRRQATIKMDANGIFQLKNLGKTSIYINGKEVASGQNLALVSGCLIEVRGLTFLFETNRKMIKQYVDSVAADDKPSTGS